MSLDRFGNTSGVTIPLTISNTLGDISSRTVNILVSGFGIGLSWGVSSFSIDSSNVLPIIYTGTNFDEGIF